MRIEKSKLPRGMSFVLKSSALERALADAGIGLETCLTHTSSGIFFDAHFVPPNRNVAYERLMVRAGAVPADTSRAARAYMEDTVLPELVAWIKDILAKPENSTIRRERQHFVRYPPDASLARGHELR